MQKLGKNADVAAELLALLANKNRLAIIEQLVDKEMSVREVADSTGEHIALVANIESMLLKAEYKRRQAPPGVKIGSRNFGRDRRYPISNFFHTGPRVKLPR